MASSILFRGHSLSSGPTTETFWHWALGPHWFGPWARIGLGPGSALVWALGLHWFGPWARIGLGPGPALVWALGRHWFGALGPHWLYWLHWNPQKYKFLDFH